MQPELFDLLQEAKEDAPPPRYGIEEVVAAGKRRQRRRNAGWAIAAVTAVVVTVGLPQIVTRHSATPRPVPPAATEPAPSTGPATRAFDYLFRGYTAGGYRVLDPSSAGLGSIAADVQKIGTDRPETPDALLEVYLPGLDPRADLAGDTRVETAPINGRSAYFFRPARPTPVPGAAPMPEQLVWQYDDNAVAVLTPTEGELPRKTQRAIAEGLTREAARPVTVPLRASFVPAGFVLVAAGDGLVLFAPEAKARETLAHPARGVLPSDGGEPPRSVSIGVRPLGAGGGARPTTVTCMTTGEVRHCRTDHERHVVMVEGRRVSEADLRRTLAGVTAADPDDRSTWFPATEAFPASAQLPRD